MEIGRECSLCNLPFSMNCREMAGNSCVEMALGAFSRWTSWNLIRHKCRLQETLPLQNPGCASAEQRQESLKAFTVVQSLRYQCCPWHDGFLQSSPSVVTTVEGTWLTPKTKWEIPHKRDFYLKGKSHSGSLSAGLHLPRCLCTQN